MKGDVRVPPAQQSSLSPWVITGPINSGRPLGYFHLQHIVTFQGRNCEADSDDESFLHT